MSALDIGWVLRPARGEVVCGDHVVFVEDETTSLLAVLDGLGHGPRAATASEAAGDYIRENPKLPLERMVRGCDAAIRHTRGVAMAVIRIHHAGMLLEHVGVGNVEVTSRSVEKVRPVPQPGIVGGRLRRVMVTEFRLHPGDVIVMHSDGISRLHELEPLIRPGAEQTAEAILGSAGLAHDDASCLVVRVGTQA